MLARSVNYDPVDQRRSTKMNGTYEPGGPFERRRLNRAILTIVAMTLAGIVLNDGFHALITAAERSSPRLQRLVQAYPKSRAAATPICQQNEASSDR
jgi:hypothetical protein